MFLGGRLTGGTAAHGARRRTALFELVGGLGRWQSLVQTLPSWLAWAAWSFTSPVGGQGAGVDVDGDWTSARRLGLEMDVGR